MSQSNCSRKTANRALKSAFLVVVLLTLTQALNNGEQEEKIADLEDNRTQDDDADWNTFKQRFKKNYTSPEEENRRRSLRAQNLQVIRQHNADAAAGKFNFTLSENSLVDLTPDEYKKLLGFRSRRRNTTRSRRSVVYLPAMPIYSNTVNVGSLPSSVNWMNRGWVGPVQNQGQCGSCWSYAAAGALSGQYYNATGQFVLLSEQNLIDCSDAEGNNGCDGGTIDGAFWYVQDNGIESQQSYSDTSDVTGLSNGTCMYNPQLSVMNITSWRNIAARSEDALQQAVALVGPVAAAIDASGLRFQLYESGVYSYAGCSSSALSLDHAILVIGYGVYNNQPYWLIQNSWGTSWGINGYMMMARNSNNMCGIATEASFPVVGWTSAPADEAAEAPVAPYSTADPSDPSPSVSSDPSNPSSSSSFTVKATFSTAAASSSSSTKDPSHPSGPSSSSSFTVNFFLLVVLACLTIFVPTHAR